mgnify:CR=1 FL=1
MSLPPLARWEYGYKAKKDSREELLTSIFTKPQDWLNDKELEKFCKENNINLDEKTCVICNKLFTEFGANPQPVKESGVCCNKCDNEVVIPARMEGLNAKK